MIQVIVTASVFFILGSIASGIVFYKVGKTDGANEEAKKYGTKDEWKEKKVKTYVKEDA